MIRPHLPSSFSSLTVLLALSLLSACATHGPRLSSRQQAARYAARAPRGYTPPGPAWNPWGPYITEASRRFNVPPQWIRAVMQVESGGQEYLNGEPTTSPAGAMGLMQIMPDTYQELQAEFGLGSDPYDPRNNILAGAAYIREMYDLFGSPGFLAAYNCGPACYEDYLAGRMRLPGETRRYVAMLVPRISGTTPGAIEYAMNQPVRPVPAAPRSEAPRRQVRIAQVPEIVREVPAPQPIRVASLAPPPQPPQPPRPAQRPQLPEPPSGFHLIPRAMADTLPPVRVTQLAGHWAIQIGAFEDVGSAHVVLNRARRQIPRLLNGAWPTVEGVREAHGMLYRARLVGLSHAAAQQACEDLQQHRNPCFLVSPAAQSS